MALLAGASLLFEISIIRIFSFTIWHHFAFMVVSIALLGFAVSGVAFHLRPGLGKPPARRAAAYALAFGVTAVVAIAVVTRLPFDPTRFGQESVQYFYLLCYYAALLIPFGLAGLAIVTLLNGYASAVGPLYMSDLAGAGLGAIAVAGVMQAVGAEGAMLVVAAAGAASAWLLRLAPGRDRQPGRAGGPRRRPRPGSLLWLAPVLALLALVPIASKMLPFPPGRSKGLAVWLDRREYPYARLAFTKWSALARIDVVEDTGVVSWTSNPNTGTRVLPQTQVVIDGDAATPIIEIDGNLTNRRDIEQRADLEFLDYTLSSSALQAFHPGRVLVIGAGGGVDVLTALRHGAAHVDAVEVNPIIVDLVTRRYAAHTGGWFANEDVTLHVGEGRSFLRRRPDRYDAIQLSLIDTWAASASGAYSLAESYLYTVEAFEDYVEHLSDDGVLTITRWLWEPPRETLKLCTVADAALRRLGVEQPKDHVVVLALGRIGNILIKRSPFTAADIERLVEVAKARQFQFIYAPMGMGTGGGRGTSTFMSFFTAPDPKAFISSYLYDISPATDDSPFFFQFGRWREAYPWSDGWRDQMVVLSGRLVLLTVLGQALGLSLVLLVLPLMARGRRVSGLRDGPPPARAIAYFFLIGLSFMLLEIALMQRFTLFLGHPIHAITFVLAALLLAAGIGSWASGRAGLKRPRLVFLGIAAVTVVYATQLPRIFHAALGLDPLLRFGLGALLILPLGFLLGVPFPAGISSLARHGRSPLIGWAWAANGCASVLGPILAVLLAIDTNFSTVMIAAAAGYAAAYLVFKKWWSGAAV
jgi:predicted membrane-bound spermidine synthase